ncbi:MAG: patatin-like phospholipase family protein [Nanoarchaeota archaeon]
MRKKVGLALSSGGARGFSHVGVIKVLKKHNIPIDYISGTSIGAMVAAYYALNLEVEGFEKEFKNFRKRDLLKLIDLNNPRISLIKGEKVKIFLSKFFYGKNFKDTKIPLSIGATVLEDGSKKIFKTGKILDAVIASGAFPGVFPPVKYKGKTLIDGGLADATPVDLVNELGAEIIIAVDLFGFHRTNKKDFDNIWKVFGRVYEIAMSRLSTYTSKGYGDNIIVLKPKGGSRTDTFAIHKANQYIKIGEKEARKHIKKIKELIG